MMQIVCYNFWQIASWIRRYSDPEEIAGSKSGRARVPARRDDVPQPKGAILSPIATRVRLRKQTDREDPTSPALGKRKRATDGYVGQAAIPPGPPGPWLR
jgi:hypothetical protein